VSDVSDAQAAAPDRPWPAAVAAALERLARLSFVAHRDAQRVLPALLRHGDEAVVDWIDACSRLHGYDRDACLAFIDQSAEIESASECLRPWTGQALRFVDHPNSWKAAQGYLSNAAAAYGLLGRRGEQRWFDLGLSWCARHADSGMAYFNTPVRDLAGRQGLAGVEQLTVPAEELFATRRLALATFLPGALRVRNLFGPGALGPWARRGADLLQIDRFRGEAHFRLESEESLRLLLDEMPGFRVLDHQRFLTMVLTAWYGREFELRDGGWSPERGRAFVETDGQRLLLPVTLPDREQAVLGALHVAGHLVYGSYALAPLGSLLEALGGNAPAPDAPVRLDALVAAHGEDAWSFQLVFDACEDLRIDAAINEIAPTHLGRMLRAAARAQRPEDRLGAYWDFALETLRYAAGGECALGRELRLALAPLLTAEATVLDAYQAAERVHDLLGAPRLTGHDDLEPAYLPGRSPNLGREVRAQPGPGSRAERDAQQRGDDGQDDQQEAGEQQEDAQAAGQDDSESDPAGGQSAQQASQGAQRGSGAARSAATTPGRNDTRGAEQGIAYPEWDYREARYKADWARVTEKRLADANPAEAARLADRHAGTLKRLKRAVQSQKPTRMAPLTRQLDGEDFDLEATVRYLTERSAGRSPDPGIYRRRVIRQRDLAVTLLADLSTSIMQTVPDGQGRLVDTVRAGVLLFAESMEEVGDPYSIAGFCSKYRDNVNYYTIKGFDEPLTAGIRATVGGLSGRLATRMGAAIRHATRSFDNVPAHRRLLLLLSDGRPEDYDDGGDRRYLHEDTRMAVKEAVNAGVHPFCITVDTLANQYLPQIFGRGHYLVLDQVSSLPAKLPEIYLRLRK
jgi:hypothetical protein